ncbi:MAG: parvulin peptidyl-prolyl isomerase [Cyanobacteria bacterium J06632_3]
MSNFESMPLLVIDQQPVSLGQALSYLQTFGKLQPFVQDVLRYHALLQALQSRDDLVVTTADLGQAIIDFRLQNQLGEQASFYSWLQTQGLEYATFEQQIIIRLKLQKLKEKIAAEQIDDYFADHQSSFEQVDLQYILAADLELAEQIKTDIEQGQSFEEIARNHPLGDGKVIVKRDVLRRQQLRAEIREGLVDVPIQTLVGPLAMGTRWCLCRVEQELPAQLDEAMRQTLSEQLFETWLQQQLQTLTVEAAPQSAQPDNDTADSILADGSSAERDLEAEADSLTQSEDQSEDEMLVAGAAHE